MYSTVTTIPPFRLLQADWPTTFLGIQYDDSTVIILRDSVDAFDYSGDTLWQFCGYPSRTPLINCGLPTQWIRRFCKVSCDLHRIFMCSCWILHQQLLYPVQLAGHAVDSVRHCITIILSQFITMHVQDQYILLLCKPYILQSPVTLGTFGMYSFKCDHV